MTINLVKIFRKRLRTELRNLGYGRIKSWLLEKRCPDEIVHNAIGEFVSPKDIAIMITQ